VPFRLKDRHYDRQEILAEENGQRIEAIDREVSLKL
jgi:hypothetical protein